MDQSNPFATLLRPEIVSALTLFPVVLQYLRAVAVRFKLPLNADVAAVLNALAVIGLVGWAGWQALFPIQLIAFQIVVAWFYTDIVFTRIVKPMGEGPNPLMPDA